MTVPQFIKQLYNCEMNFYFQLVHHCIDLSNVMVVKTLGDEVWLVLDINKMNVKYNTIEFNKILVSKNQHTKLTSLLILWSHRSTVLVILLQASKTARLLPLPFLVIMSTHL